MTPLKHRKPKFISRKKAEDMDLYQITNFLAREQVDRVTPRSPRPQPYDYFKWCEELYWQIYPDRSVYIVTDGDRRAVYVKFKPYYGGKREVR